MSLSDEDLGLPAAVLQSGAEHQQQQPLQQPPLQQQQHGMSFSRMLTGNMGQSTALEKLQQQLERIGSDMSLSDEEDLGLPAAVLQSAATYQQQQQQQQQQPLQQQSVPYCSRLAGDLIPPIAQQQQQQQQQLLPRNSSDMSLSEEGVRLPASALHPGAQQQQQQQHGNDSADRGGSGGSASRKSISQQPNTNSSIQKMPAAQQQQQQQQERCAGPDQQEIALAAEAAAALLKFQSSFQEGAAAASAGQTPVSVYAFYNFCKQQWPGVKGQQKLVARLGGSAAAAAAFLQQWRHIFLLHNSSRRSEVAYLQLQQGAVSWLLTAAASRPILQAYRDGLVAAARKADAAAPTGQRKGVDLSHAADPNLRRYMTPLVLPFRQLFDPVRQFLDAVGVLDELQVVMVSVGKQQLIPKTPAPKQQQQQECGNRSTQQQQATRRALAACAADEQQQQQQHLQEEGYEEEGEWREEVSAALPDDCSTAAELHSSKDHPIRQGPSAATAAATATMQEVAEPSSGVAACSVTPAGAVAADAMHGSSAAAAAAAAAAYPEFDGNAGDEDIDDVEQRQLVIDAVTVLQSRSINGVPLNSMLGARSRTSSGGNDRKLYVRVGGSKAAAVAWLQRWPQVFRIQQVPLNPPGAGGATSCCMVQLQQGAVQWLLSLRHCQRELAEYRDGLLAGVRRAAVAAALGERRGVEIGQAGNPGGYMTAGLLPYRQVRLCA
jgi:hypothetical protein